jgi:hypothetical protein
MSEKRPPGPLIHESFLPIQNPNNGDDRKVYTATYGGPQAALDARMIITGAMLEKLTKVAKASHLGSATLPCPGLQIDVYQQPDGHQYEVWSFVSRAPVPSKTTRG